MIRRDYFMRMVQEMAQVLARVISLKHRQEYDQAMKEISTALKDLRDGNSTSPEEPTLSDWICLCQKHGAAASGLMVAVADLLKEQGDMQAIQHGAAAGHSSRSLALGLLLEALLNGETFVSAELLEKVERLACDTWSSLADGDVWLRLVRYFEARGRYAQAEDALFAWRETGDLAAVQQGLAFYERMLAKKDDELASGNLPRAEVEQGRREIARKQ